MYPREPEPDFRIHYELSIPRGLKRTGAPSGMSIEESRLMSIYDRAQASGYARHRHVHPGVLQALLYRGSIHPATRVLDVGCGPGHYLWALEQTVGCKGWGLDPSWEMLSSAKTRLPHHPLCLGRAESLPYPCATFDLVFSVDVIHHVEDRPAYFRQAYRVLKLGGRICTVTDSEEIIRHRQPLSVYFPETVDIDLQRYPRLADLRAMMKEAGFHVLQEEKVSYRYMVTSLQPFQDKAFSSLHLISEEAFERGLQRMEQALRRGPLPAVSRYVLLWGVKPVSATA